MCKALFRFHYDIKPRCIYVFRANLVTFKSETRRNPRTRTRYEGMSKQNIPSYVVPAVEKHQRHVMRGHDMASHNMTGGACHDK